jgi:MerR family mercuric resistance operon transcriptional regulator
MPSHAFTISKLADAAGVNIETVRYYQRRGLLDEPSKVHGGFRSYDETHVQRLQFIKRAQELGFSLDDAAELLSLSKVTNRKRLREITRSRMLDVQQKIAQLESMATALEGLIDCCARTASNLACPIIAALAGNSSDKPTSGHEG